MKNNNVIQPNKTEFTQIEKNIHSALEESGIARDTRAQIMIDIKNIKNEETEISTKDTITIHNAGKALLNQTLGIEEGKITPDIVAQSLTNENFQKFTINFLDAFLIEKSDVRTAVEKVMMDILQAVLPLIGSTLPGSSELSMPTDNLFDLFDL